MQRPRCPVASALPPEARQLVEAHVRRPAAEVPDLKRIQAIRGRLTNAAREIACRHRQLEARACEADDRLGGRDGLPAPVPARQGAPRDDGRRHQDERDGHPVTQGRHLRPDPRRRRGGRPPASVPRGVLLRRRTGGGRIRSQTRGLTSTPWKQILGRPCSPGRTGRRRGRRTTTGGTGAAWLDG